MKVEFKNEYFGEDWQEWNVSDFGVIPYDEERAAELISEYLYNQEPEDANKVNDIIEIKTEDGIKKFKVTADYSVDFYAREIE